MKNLTLAAAVIAAAIVVAGCDTATPTDPGPDPEGATMNFKQGARYQFTSYRTAADDPQRRSDSSSRTWTLVAPSISAHGKTGVALYVDSVVALSGVGAVVVDSIWLTQESGNYVYRYASLAPELDFAGQTLVDVDLGRQWMREARLNASAAGWLVGEASDTVNYETGIPGIDRLKVTVQDSAVASATESLMIDGEAVPTTRTTHKLELSISILVTIGPVTAPVKIASTSLTRTTWTSSALGAIVREEREGKVIDASYQGQSFSIPVPGYVSLMTKVLVRGI